MVILKVNELINIYNLNKLRWKGHIRPVISCLNCGKNFMVSPSTARRGKKYCSMDCYNKNRNGLVSGEKHYNWQGGKIIKKCIVCKNEFSVKREQEKRTGAKFCSESCRSIYNVRYKHGSSNTDIEKIIESSLLKLQIQYEKQIPIDGVALVDFLLKNKNIIQCDGDYWHSLPTTRDRDQRQDNYLRSVGYTVLRLPGSLIKKNLALCENKIMTLDSRK